MAELQTTYTEGPAIAYAGMVASGALSNRITRTIEDAAGIAFGVAAFRGANPHGCTATPAAGMGLGFTIATDALGLLPGAAADVYPQYENVAVMPEGEIFVNAAVAVTAGDPVYITSAKAITNVATSNIAMSGWVFDSTITAAGLVRVAKR